MSSQASEPTLADVQRQYPRWRCWRGVSGVFYARRADAPQADNALVEGEDPLDLRDQINRAQALSEQ